tara:strand:- start:149 stop:370 length:222 start_codon:yes stop_codon:yes gene_type:complete
VAYNKPSQKNKELSEIPSLVTLDEYNNELGLGEATTSPLDSTHKLPVGKIESNMVAEQMGPSVFRKPRKPQRG